MRLILVFLIFSLLGAPKCSQREKITGIWFSQNFGLLSFEENNTQYFSTLCKTQNTLVFNEAQKELVIKDVLFQPCKKNGEVKVKLVRGSENELLLISEDECFSNRYSKSQIKLDNFHSKFSPLNFEKIKIRKRGNSGVWEEVVITNNELEELNLNSDDFLSIEEQIWIIFESGFDFHNEYHTPLVEMTLELGIGDYRNVKTINTYPHPCYLSSFLNYVLEKF